MKQNEQLLRYTFTGYSGKQLANYMMSFMGSVVDGIVISRFLGDDPMAAFQLVLPLTMLASTLGMVFSNGLQTACSKCLGSGQLDEAKSYYTVTMLAMVPIALLWAASVYFSAESLAVGMGASGDSAYLAGEATDYLRGVAPALALMVFLPTQNSVMFLEGKSKYSIISLVCQLSINVGCDLLNAFYLGWGLLGMGLATSLSNVVGFMVMLFGMSMAKGGIGFTRVGLTFSKLLSILRTGIPSAMESLYESIQTSVVNNVLLIVGTATSLAAFGVVDSLSSIFSPFILGITVTGMTIAGIFYGERDKEGLRRLFSLTLKRAIAVGLCLAAVVMVVAPALVLLFKNSSDPSFDKVVHALRIFVWIYPLYGINKTLQDFYLGCNTIKMTYLISLLENLVFITLSVVVLGNIFGEDGVWYGFVVGEVLCIITTLIIIAISKKRVPRTAEDMMFLDPLFDKVESTARDWSVTTLEEMREASQELQQFMVELGASEDETALFSQYMNEMSTVMTAWGASDSKPYYIDFRLVGIPVFGEDGIPDMNKMETWKFRIRDNARQFDVQKWNDIHHDKAEYSAIQAITKKAQETSYGYTLNLNYLLITI